MTGSNIQWKRAINGYFEDPSLWKGGVAPGASDDAALVATGPAFAVIADASETVASLQLGANATLVVIAGANEFTATGGTGVGANAGTITVGDGATFAAGGMVDNSGMIELNSAGSVTSLFFASNATLSGGGTVVMGGSDATIDALALGTVTNVDNTISGSGALFDGGYALTATNEAAGVIDADQAAAALVLGGDDGVGIVNAGLIEATNKATLQISYTGVDGAGGVIAAGTGSTVSLYGALVSGQTLRTAAGGVIDLDYSQATVAGVIDNAGVIEVEGLEIYAVFLQGDTTLTGGGTLTLGNSQDEVKDAGPASVLTNDDNLIEGVGALGAGWMALVNQAAGTIDANGGVKGDGDQLVIDTGSNVIANAGLIEASGKGVLVVTSALANDGVIATDGGTASIMGAVSGGGKARIDGGRLDFASGFDQNVAFTGASGVLELARSQSFTATVTGFSTTGGTALDLRDIGFTGPNEATFSGTATSGVLTVSDGTRTARIDLVGDYLSSSFVTSSDGHGGVTIVDPGAAGTPAHAFVAAMASFAPAPVGAVRLTGHIDGQAHAMLASPRIAIA